MSINEVIKQYLPIAKQKMSYANKQYNYCGAYCYQNCQVCKDVKKVRCCKKLVYQSAKQINHNRWHLYFLCQAGHLVLRSVSSDGKFIIVGQIKN